MSEDRTSSCSRYRQRWIHVLEHEGWTEHPEPGTERLGGVAITREGSGQLGGSPERYETCERRCQGVARRPAQAVRVCADGHPSPISCAQDPNSKGRPPNPWWDHPSPQPQARVHMSPNLEGSLLGLQVELPMGFQLDSARFCHSTKGSWSPSSSVAEW